MRLNEFHQPCPECGGPAFSSMILAEKKDACYYKVKASAKVWPSAYASGRLVQCRKKGAANYGNKSEGVAEAQLDEFSPGASNSSDDTGDDPYKYPDPKPYGRSINYFGQFEADHFDKEDVNNATGEFKGYWNYDGKPRLIAYFRFNDPAKTGSDDPGTGWYYEPQNEGVSEEWSQKYKSSINCSHPKGFSQRAHCAGKKKHNESIEMEMVCEDCGMCATHGDHSRYTLDEACWKGYHKEGMKTMFGKRYPNCVKNEDASDATNSGPNILELLRSWRNRVPAKYAWHLTKTFGDPHDATNDIVIWHDQDGFKRIEIKDEYVMHISPSPHYDYCYSYIDLEVPHRLSSALAECSESILIDHLKNEVGARCASLAANAVTLNFVMDVVAGRTPPSRDEYEQRIMDMHHDFDNKKIFTIQWWPDQSHDTDPANPYYTQQHKSNTDVAEDRRIARKAGQPANSKKHSDLYTDENPQGTITGLKFATAEDARASVSKIKSSGRSHAHKIQAAVAMEQRARAAGKASAAAVYRAYINANKKTNEQQLDEKCWDGYSQQGMKEKGSRMVPNCVKNTNEEASMTDELDRILVLGGVKLNEELIQEFDLIESIIDQIAEQNGVDAEVIWEDLESLTEDELYAFAVTSQLNEDWQKANKQDRTAGMSQKAVNAYRREHPGSKLKTAVTTKPSKLKRGSKASKRRKSYCSRSRGQMKMHNISCAKTPDKAICKARRRWNC